MGVKTQVFSLGDYRRKLLGGAQDIPPDYFTYGALFPQLLSRPMIPKSVVSMQARNPRKPTLCVVGSRMAVKSLYLISSISLEGKSLYTMRTMEQKRVDEGWERSSRLRAFMSSS
jgi:hypothetical protein